MNIRIRITELERRVEATANMREVASDFNELVEEWHAADPQADELLRQLATARPSRSWFTALRTDADDEPTATIQRRIRGALAVFACAHHYAVPGALVVKVRAIAGHECNRLVATPGAENAFLQIFACRNDTVSVRNDDGSLGIRIQNPDGTLSDLPA